MINVCAMMFFGDRYRAWVKDDKFKVIEVDKNDDTQIIDDQDYKDYEHFWGVYGKFNPWLGFLPEENWQKIDTLTFENLQKIYSNFKMTG
jgi:hypothetical protein